MENTAVVEKYIQASYDANRDFLKEWELLPEPLKKAVSALSKLSEAERAQTLNYDQRYRELKRRENFWKSFTEIPDDAPVVIGKAYNWPQFWFDRLLGIRQNNLLYLPYKQCHWCGQTITRKKNKSFCSDEHALAFRKWRDNARRVGRRKSHSDQVSYYLEKIYELYSQNNPPYLLPVVYAAYKLATQWINEIDLPMWQEYLEKHEVNEFFLIEPRKHKVIQKLLKQYQHRRVMQIENIDPLKLNIHPHEIGGLLSFSSFMTDEFLLLK